MYYSDALFPARAGWPGLAGYRVNLHLWADGPDIVRSHQDDEPGAGQPDYPVQRADGRPDRPATRWQAPRGASPALKFVLMVGVMSFFADFTYEGSRSVIGPYLGTLGRGRAGDQRDQRAR